MQLQYSRKLCWTVSHCSATKWIGQFVASKHRQVDSVQRFFILSSTNWLRFNQIYTVLSLQELCCRTIVTRTSVYGIEQLPLPNSLKSCLKSYWSLKSFPIQNRPYASHKSSHTKHLKEQNGSFKKKAKSLFTSMFRLGTWYHSCAFINIEFRVIWHFHLFSITVTLHRFFFNFKNLYCIDVLFAFAYEFK